MNNGFYGGYPPYPYQSQLAIDKVLNLDDAKRYPIANGATVYLIDQEEPYLYLKTSDSQGHVNLRAFSLSEVDVSKITDSRYITKDDFDVFKKDILQSINSMRGERRNGKSVIDADVTTVQDQRYTNNQTNR